jgi:formamidopyrimidine-DNA glycosylase
MTGRVLIRDPKEKKDKWVKVLLQIKKDDDVKHLRFADMRMFGRAELMSPESFVKLAEKYGPEPLDAKVGPQEFLDLLQSKRSNIKNVLLDQKIISGLGNIYATDALFIAKVHPETQTEDLTPEIAKKLLNAARSILEEGIKNRGATLPDRMYVDAFGKSGKQQKYFRIYMKEICPECETKVVFKKIAGRGTYFCPECQVLGGQPTLL